MHTQDTLIGCILGTALGDSLGLPYEGLSRRRGHVLYGPPGRHHLVFGRGMISDDTEHTCMVAQALLVANGDLQRFERAFAWQLRLWLLGLPAGVGLATLRAILKLWIGIPPRYSGVFSAGNGPAMRAAILGVAIPDSHVLRDFVRVSTRITHTDPKAEYGAMVIALAARWSAEHPHINPEDFLENIRHHLGAETQPAADELFILLNKTVASVRAKQDTVEFAETLGLGKGVSGYMYHTVPVVIHAWLSHPKDAQAAIIALIRCGGDTDSTAAMVGGIVGAGVGEAGLPKDGVQKILEWPRSVAWMRHLGTVLAQMETASGSRHPLPLFGLSILPRNGYFLLVILMHGLRRLLPPY